MKYALTDAQRAQILAGGSELDLGEAPPAAAVAAVLATPATETVPAAAVSAAAAVEVKVAVDAVSVLQTQVTDKDAALLAANIKIATLEAASADSLSNLPALLQIAQGVIGSMQVALGGSDTAKVLSAKDAISEHARLLPIYTEKFKVGGIVVPHATAAEEPKVHPDFAQRLSLIKS